MRDTLAHNLPLRERVLYYQLSGPNALMSAMIRRAGLSIWERTPEIVPDFGRSEEV